ncbi:MAG: hypothetical protein ABF560_07080 [Bifidobacterium aquikefiri]|uniref:hypothetical protein n=2 Tax=Bifidobacterium aquikefiri TaxID=1653207 RepID=UPI0023F0E288|nr:hypothetical protein [Bifidobacterium aquikefiri]
MRTASPSIPSPQGHVDASQNITGKKQPMNDAIVEDGENFKQFHQFNKYLKHDGDCFAGGFAKHVFEGKKPRDLDMYFTDSSHYEDTLSRMLADGWEQTYKNDHATGVRKDGQSIDLVTYIYGDAESVIGEFDFTVTKFAWRLISEDDEVKFEAVFHPDFFEHLETHRLVIDDKMVLPISTFQRMFKYTRYGFNLCRESKVKLLLAIRNWEPHNSEDTADELEEALTKSLEESMD